MSQAIKHFGSTEASPIHYWRWSRWLQCGNQHSFWMLSQKCCSAFRVVLVWQ